VLVLRDVGPLRRRVVEALEASERRLRRHEATLEHVTRLSTLGEMSAGLAHELNQPLTAILAHGQAALRMLEDPAADRAGPRRSVEATVAQARRAAAVVANLRRLVRRAPGVARPVDVSQAVENVVALVRDDVERLGVDLRADPGREPLLIRGDPVQLEQVLLNLVRNALEAVRDREVRVVEVRASAAPDGVRIEVLDSGPGLSPEVRDRLFSPFVTTKPDGLGLGLSLSQGLVHGMDGELRGADRPGGGAAFEVALPRLQEASARA
jgi:C4-dicarboxylate-specific signal transduction histidine kinase